MVAVIQRSFYVVTLPSTNHDSTDTYHIEKKQQWSSHGESTSKKAMLVLTAGKTITNVSWNSQDVIYIDKIDIELYSNL